MVFGLAIVVTATVGDLSESLIKRDLGIKDMILLSNSPTPKIVGLEGYGLNLAGRRAIDDQGATTPRSDPRRGRKTAVIEFLG